MKRVKLAISFFILMIIGMTISYADTSINTRYNRLSKALEISEANFKFYNVKINSVINHNLSNKEFHNIFIEIINNLKLDKKGINWNQKGSGDKIQLCATIKGSDKEISIKGINKNNKESYIVVDILDNKVYKHKEVIYSNVENVLNKYSYQVDVSACIVGEYTKRLQNNKYDDILQKILYNMSAKQIDEVKDVNFLSITAYSKVLNDYELEYLGEKINLNIGIKYNEDDGRTLIYIATPIIKLDY
ncbi:YwmB family TATA-box binding protein [Clostridioides difficile]|uniref:YwmB family TATA-box binding protein n=1 Tax=Clostridioides difficile TaxID=1496 RepID=UPI0029C2D7B2|nr:YwmB family TATA-box binding protein [Clostridioides difficile]MDX5615897.1 YwmB family TATA-box binding protein [Clostridioides difficile]